MARWRGCWVFFFLLSAVLFSSCATLSPHNLPSDETTRAPSESRRDAASAGRSLERMGADELSAPVSASVAEKGDSEGEEPPQDGEGLTNQELIDSA
ncbi:MAG: hypothetical protein R6X07_14570, partial [Desulfatiglandales bacterium]